jgi:hypothetical protein
MNWVITHDSEQQKRYTGRYDGRFHNCLRSEILQGVQNLADTLPYEFRLLDDDGEVYFEGKCGDLNEADGDQAFEPLDWAETRYGCTKMQYRKVGNEKWETP